MRTSLPSARALLALLSVFVLACSDAPEGDSAEEVVVEEAPTGLVCDTLDIRVTGDDPPSVGDAWTVWLWCNDDTLLTGATRVSFDPNDIATVSSNEVEFLKAGEATLTVQVGSRRESRDVTVSE
jgi:hypothetical protein